MIYIQDLFCGGWPPLLLILFVWVTVRVFNATFNNISIISWHSVLLAEETGLAGEIHRSDANHCQTFSHYVVSTTPCLSGIRTHNISGDRH